MKDKGQTLTSFTNIHKTRNLYITGHLDGTISFWDASCPLLLQIFMIKQQVPSNPQLFDGRLIVMHLLICIRINMSDSLITMQNEDNTSSGNPITSLQFDMPSSILISGDTSGMVSHSTSIKHGF